MKYWERWLVYPLLGISLLFSIAVLCRYCPRIVEPDNLGFDYMGVIVGALSLLIGFLVGWQIYKTIEIDKKMEVMNNGSRDAIAEDMFYNGYAKLTSLEYIYPENYISTIRICVAALNLNFSEDKASLLYELIDRYGDCLGIYCEETMKIEKLIDDLENMKYNSKSIRNGIKRLNIELNKVRNKMIERNARIMDNNDK